MKIRVLGTILATAFAASSVFAANLASDTAADVVYDDGLQTGDNGGTGFSSWTITSSGGSGGAGGVFIGDPAAANISGMDTESFGMYANDQGSGAFATADRDLTGGALSVGQTFSFEWGVNFDSGGTGNKGFNLYVGGVSGTEVVNVNMGGSSAITFNGTDVGFGYGTQAMTWEFTMTDATTLSVSANDRDGSGAFTTNITIASGVDSVRFYASDLESTDFATERQPYFNNLAVVPEPSTIVLGVVGMLGLVVARRRMQK